MNGARPAAEVFAQAQALQRLASDPTMHAFVAANAGSGKTRVLVDRVVRLLLAGAEPDRILCLTYTKAAASEMLDRLYKKLGDWSIFDDARLKDALDEVGAQAADPRAARALFARALETPGGLKIETIHAFCTRLLRRFPLEAGAPPGFVTLEEREAAELAREARRRVGERAIQADGDALAEAYEVIAAQVADDAFERFLEKIAANFADYEAAKDRHNGRAGLVNLAASRLGVEPGARVADVKAQAWAALDRAGLATCAERLAGGTKNDQKLSVALRSGLAAPSAEAGFDALVAALFTKGGEGPLAKSPVTKSSLNAHPILLDLIGSEEGGYGREAKRLEAARDRVRSVEILALTRAGLTIADAYLDAYTREKRRRGALDFADLIDAARRLLSSAEAAQWVLYKLDGGVEHVLVDEAQDTSPQQWDVIRALTEEFLAGEGGPRGNRTVFAVGDEKQSIYGFQGARPERFLETSRWIENSLPDPERQFTAPSLVASFRSAPAILRAVDAVFDDDAALSIMLPGDAPPGAEAARPRHLAVREDIDGAVDWWPLAPRPENGEAFNGWAASSDTEVETAAERLAREIAGAVAAWLARAEAVSERDAAGKTITRALRPGDVMVLVRRRSTLFDRLIPALKKAGVPVAGADRLTLAAELAVEDLIGAARVGLAADDDLALAEFLVSPFLRPATNGAAVIDDAVLFDLAYGRKGSLAEALAASDDPRFAEAAALVAALQESAGRSTPFAFFTTFLERSSPTGESYARRLFKRVGPEAEDPLESFLDRALVHERAGAPSLERFVAEIAADRLRIKRESGETRDEVRVMTIHGAKGLEAPVVVIADAADDGSGDKADAPFVDADEGVLWSPRAAVEPAEAARRRQVRDGLRDGEDLRLLYVALTRAKDRLVVCGAERTKGDAAASWHGRVGRALQTLGATPIETPFGEGLRFGRLEPGVAPEPRSAALDVIVPDWARRPAAVETGRRRALTPSEAVDDAQRAPAALSPLSPATKPFLTRGRLIHKLLEILPETPAATRADAAQRYLERRGVPAADARTWTAEVLALLDDAEFAPLFGPSSRAEVSIAGAAAGLDPSLRIDGRIDRLAFTSDAVLAVDYKTDRPPPANIEAAPPAYLEQLALYRAVLTSAYPGRRIRCALVWTFGPRLMPATDSMLDAALRRLTDRAGLHT